MVVLERLADAERNGHRVLAVMRGSAVNQDGASNGLTAPNGPSQQRVIMQALANAKLSPQQIAVVEGHGTGTTLGDPIEAQALLTTYGRNRPADSPLWLGSIKSNIGHTQAAAGVAGVIKMVLAMRHGVLPRTLHVDEPSSQVDWSAGAVSLLTEEVSWQRNGEPRRAGVSSFGISGTNAHVILEEAPPPQEPFRLKDGQRGAENGSVAWVLSGRGEDALVAQAARLAGFLEAGSDLAALDVGLSLAHRPALEHRAVLMGAESEHLREGLAALARAERAPNVVQGIAAGGGERLAVMFTGQGAQRVGMGSELYRSLPAFAEAFDEVCLHMDQHLGRSLRGVVFGEGRETTDTPSERGLLDDTLFTQASLFALEVAIYRLVESWGLEPDFLIGHSIGELVGAFVAGVFSLEDACRLVAARGRLMAGLPAGGAMVAVQASEEELLPTLEGLEDDVALAGVNGPTAMVISGEETAVLRVAAIWEQQGRKTRQLRVSHAFHSPRMDGMLDAFRTVAEDVSFKEPAIPLVSNLTGEALAGELCTAEYWVRHVREPVRFADGIRWLDRHGVSSFLEMGPDGVLSGMVDECLSESLEDRRAVSSVAAPALRGDRPELSTLHRALAQMWVRGCAVDWTAMYDSLDARQRVELPPYAFQRKHYWLHAARGKGDLASVGQVESEHPLLAAAVRLGGGQGLLFTGRLSLEDHPWLRDHAVMGAVLLPGTAFVELALSAGEEAGLARVEELTIETPLVLTEHEDAQLQVFVGEMDGEGVRPIAIYSRSSSDAVRGSGDDWVRHASGLLSAGAALERRGDRRDDFGALSGSWPPAGARPMEIDHLYDRLAEVGFDYGPEFRAVRGAWSCEGDLFAEVRLSDDRYAEADAFGLHPALLDSAFHVGLVPSSDEASEDSGPSLPFCWHGVELYTGGARALRVRLRAEGAEQYSLLVADQSGEPVASVESLLGRVASTAHIEKAAARDRDSLLTLGWEVHATLQANAHDSSWALLSGADDLVEALVQTGGRLDVYSGLDAFRDSIDGGGEVPDCVLFDVAGKSRSAGAEDLHAATHEVARSVLSVVQTWLADERLASGRLVLLTHGAVAVQSGEPLVQLEGSPAWGLVRSAQAEHPGRFVLVDTDSQTASLHGLLAEIEGAIADEESQLAIRHGVAYAPRLIRIGDRAPRQDQGLTGVTPAIDAQAGTVVGMADGLDTAFMDAQGTVLITGGTGGLGGALALNLVIDRGVRHLVLVSRRGSEAEGALELQAQLQEHGAHVGIAACDVSDRDQLRTVIESISAEHPLRAVVHTAGITDNALVDSLTVEQLEQVLTTKANGALLLHELTIDHELDAFVLFSSMAGVTGGPGQGNYAAANAFLDALACQRRAQGLPATSLAWGLWSDIGMGRSLGEAEMRRMAGTSSLGVISPEEGLALFGPALASGEAVVLPVRLDRAVLRSEARSGALPPLIRGLAGVQVRKRSSQSETLSQRLAGISGSERTTIVENLVRGEVAGVLGYSSGLEVDPSATLKDLGFDSLAAVELRNSLGALTGLRLPATLVFDYPTCVALTGYLLASLTDEETSTAPVVAAVTHTEEPFAIVGIGCRYPGGVSSAEGLWDLVYRGGDGVSDFPTDRGWELDALYDPDPERPGTSYTREGGFLHDATEFDAHFFGIGPREAVAMDPQQRLLLEVSWEALEDAGINPLSLAGSRTGVFTGVMNHDYGAALVASLSGGEHEGYLGTGVAGSVASGRVAYALGLEGPAMTVDTACSSSLVAIHLACQALRQGECSLALAGGASIHSTPGLFVDFSRQRALSPDGRCKSFSAAADGAGWSEGVGVLVLERLSEARRNGHPVLALVRGSAVNQDGASNGLTAPNGPSQQRVILQALASAGLTPAEIDAVEAHGTGTKLGDPIEAQALIATYARERDNGRPLWVGSVKSNIGHALAAAGAAGVIKMVMALKHESLPKTVHAQEPSTEIDWSGAIALLQDDVPWRRNGRKRRAGVSSFGISGTNAHVILEEAPAELPSAQSVPTAEPSQASSDDPAVGLAALGALPLVVSARGEAALRAQAERLLTHMTGSDQSDPLDVGYSLAVSRAVLEHRAVLVCEEREQLLEDLTALARGNPSASVAQGVARAGGGVAFLFSGQGSQRVGMGHELYRAFPVFREAIDEMCVHLDDHLLEGGEGHRLLDVLFATPDSQTAELIDRTAYTQAGLFVLEVALFRLLASFGLKPSFLLGHSIGELAAAHVSGVFSAQDACKLVAARGRLMESLPEGGAMVALQASELEVVDCLEGLEDRVAVAAVNSPCSIVLSGAESDILELASLWRERDRKATLLKVSRAFHSPLMDGMLEQFREVAQTIAFSKPSIPIVSNLTGAVATAELLCSADYWVRHVREPVRFVDGVGLLAQRGISCLVELGPGGVLSAISRECLQDPEAELGDVDSRSESDGKRHSEQENRRRVVTVTPLLREGRADGLSLVQGLASVWVSGVDVDWGALYTGTTARQVTLPSYAFQRERFWLGSGPRRTGDVRGIGLASADHPMLGAAVELPGEGWLFTGRLSLQEHSWLADHVVMGKVLLPGTAFLELALHVGARVGCDGVRELVMQAPLVLGERDGVQLQVRVGEVDESGFRPLSVSSRVESTVGDVTVGEDSSEWVCHAIGSLVAAEYDGGVEFAGGVDRDGVVSGDEGAWPPAGAEPVSVEDVYDELAERGLDYGPVFQGLARAWQSGNEVFAEVLLPDGEIDRASAFGLHPALLDAALHTMALAGSVDDSSSSTEVRLPFSWNDVKLVGGGASRLRVRIAPVSEDAVSIAVADESGRPVASIGSLAVRGVSAIDFGESNGGQPDMFGVEWVEAAVDVSAAGRGSMMFATCSVDVCDSVRSAGFGCEVFADVESLGEALERGAEFRTVLLDAGAHGLTDPGKAARVEVTGATVSEQTPSEGMPHAVKVGLHSALSSLQAWLLDERLSECRMAVVTRGAVALDVQEDVSDLVGAAVWGLARSAQVENPDRFVLIDVDGEDSCWEVLGHALALDEPQIALRRGRAYVARLGSVYGDGVLASPGDGRAWRLGAGREGTLESLVLVGSPEGDGPLAAGEVRVELRAAGLNFRDVLVALGMYPGRASVGGEGAGVVVEVGEGVSELALGQRVMGLMDGAMGNLAVADARAVAPVPEAWSFTQAASAPLAFATAYHGLVDLAGLKPGERVLVHAAAGGVGIAAAQIARYLGAEVFGTASPSKWDVLRALGIADTHMASSRTLDFKRKFLETTGGEGVDVVLNSLAGEFVDASLDLLVKGGRFLEMGKTDIRDSQALKGERPGAVYRPFDLMEAGPQRLHEILRELVGLFECGALELLPLTTWNVRRARQAFRHMSQGQHVGKNVLRLPATIGNEGTVLITGGTVGLGALAARHLVVEHGVRHLLLVSRRGSRASGVSELVEELSRLGAHVSVAECDVSDRTQVEQLLAGIPEEHPLDTVIHAAGVIDDGVIGSLTPERIDRVLAAKVDGAWNLHELTIDLDLSAFVLFSSVAATMGSPGQGNYAAANAFLDALAVRRGALGLAGTSIAWGLWAQESDMTSHLGDIDHTRMNRMGVLALSTEEGFALFDAALAANEALIVSARLDMKALRARARDGELHALLRELVSVRPRAASGSSHGSLAELVAHTAQGQRGPVVLELVRSETARVLGHRTPDAVEAQRPFKEMGFDSLAGVELRNRLAAQTGMRLPATLVFDYPTPEAVAGYLLEEVAAQTSAPADGASVDLEQLQRALSTMSAKEAQRSGMADALQSILSTWASTGDASETDEGEDDLSSATDEEIFDLIDRDLGVS